jgi:cell division protein FtsI (penicillin-binding protein 3)
VANEPGSRFTLRSVNITRVLCPSTRGQRVARREDAAVPLDWRGTLRARLFVFTLVFALWTVAIEARLVYFQVFARATLQGRADRQQLTTVTLSPKRGEILDRNGHLLAYSVDADTIAADPSKVDDPVETARLVCAALQTCDAELRGLMTERLRRKGQFVYLARRVGPDAGDRVKSLDLPGLMYYKESQRYYPKKELAAHVLGYVGLDNNGLAGLESTYETRISGKAGRILIQQDARERAIAVREQRLPTAGDSLELTIDQYLQHIAERELRAGVEEDNAAGGTAIIMQPQTGEILALANWPTFNPNLFSGASPDARRNRAVQDVYEPGSTFKLVTASAALEEGVTHPGELIDCAPGFLTVPGRARPIRDVHTYGVLPFTDVMVKSSNVGAIRVGWRLGAERLSRYVQRFGFGQALAPDFRGESPGIVWSPSSLDASALASMSMGYQVAVTPLQMASAVSAVANGGMLIEPRVVRAFIHDGQREEIVPNTLGRAITAETAATLTEIMEQVVDRGTAKSAQIAGYTIAGKTGTASKLIDRQYSKSEYNASFVGFVPSRAPALAIIVVIDSPHGRGYYGGTVAAPVFKRIAEASMRHLGIGPSLNAPPPVLVARRDENDRRAEDTVRHSGPAAAWMAASIDSAQAGLMPDLRGLSAREAASIVTRVGMTPRLKGQGFVLEQAPLPGTPLVRGKAADLTLGRRSPSVPVAGGTPQ